MSERYRDRGVVRQLFDMSSNSLEDGRTSQISRILIKSFGIIPGQ